MRNLKASWENSLREVALHYVTKTEQLNHILLPLEAELVQIWAEEQYQGQEYEALLNIKMELQSEITTCPICWKKGRTSVLVMPMTQLLHTIHPKDHHPQDGEWKSGV